MDQDTKYTELHLPYILLSLQTVVVFRDL